ncbi:hypothetical protein EGP99_05725 [bacterium]|nr:hypothetical protein [bacterium]
MKNKKMWFIGGCVILIILLVVSIILINKKDNKNSNEDGNKGSSLVEEAASNSGKKKEDYKKFLGGEVLNQNTYFNEYTFISNNKAYIFDPSKLESGEFSYRKVLDIPDDIKIVNIGIPYGADIHFITSDDKYYSIEDTNLDNKVEAGYNMFANAKYELQKFYDSYTEKTYEEKLDYDLIFNLHMVKDNIIYKLTIPFESFYDKKFYPFTKTKVEGNYEGEKILNVYNDRIIRTDKAFYEVVDYYKNGERTTSTLKMNMLSKYYDDVLTFTYKYVVLKDYTLIPISDTFTNRNKKYVEYNYKDCFEEEIKDFTE